MTNVTKFQREKKRPDLRSKQLTTNKYCIQKRTTTTDL